MTLAALIRKSESGKVATATPATVATLQGDAPSTVATVATVAVANLPESNIGGVCRHWELHFMDREPLEVIFSDDLAFGDVLALYPAAIAALPLESEFPESATATVATSATPSPIPVLPTCEQCRNLSTTRDRDGFRRCRAAGRGELPGVHRRSCPDTQAGRRCVAFAPLSGDPDQRSGAERWPTLGKAPRGAG